MCYKLQLPWHKKLSILKVDDIFKLQVLKFYFNYCHNNVPICLQSFDFVGRSETHYVTRNKEKLGTTKTRTKIAGLSLRHVTFSIVNDTASSIIDKIYTHVYIKKYIINTCQIECTSNNCCVCNTNNV